MTAAVGTGPPVRLIRTAIDLDGRQAPLQTLKAWPLASGGRADSGENGRGLEGCFARPAVHFQTRGRAGGAKGVGWGGGPPQGGVGAVG